MAICLPGMASRLNLAATSATRSAPFVITMNCISTMMRKMIKPTTTFPLSTKSPKALMTWPDEPILVRMFLVVETLIPSLNRVVTSSGDGKMENSRGSRMVMVVTRIIMERDIFNIIATSTRPAGSGMINSSMIISTKSTTE